MKLKRYNVSDDYYRNGFSEDDRGDWCMSVHVDALEAENESLRCRLEKAEGLLEEWHEYSDIPEKNCSCHINPPCGDCVAWGGIRYVDEATKRFLGERV